MSVAQSKSTQTVFFGGIVGFNDISDPSNTSLLRDAGNAGLYMHASALSAAYDAGELGAIAQAMSGTGPGEIEFGLVDDAVGFFSGWWVQVCLDQGLRPTEANVNCDFTSPDFLASWNKYVLAANAVGIANVAPVFSPNSSANPLDSFTADPAYASIRAAALTGGALALDAPPAFFFGQSGQYQRFIEQEIQWAQANHLRTTVILSPYGDDGTFLADTKTYVNALAAAAAVPNEWVVENYDAGDSNGVGSDTQTNSIAGVALWVAQNAPVSGPALATAPAPVTFGSGPDTLTLSIDEDAYLGDAQFTVAVDNVQIGGVLTASASHANAQSQMFNIKGGFGSGAHTITVTFVNDAWGGTPAADRNLYVTAASYDGRQVDDAQIALMADGSNSVRTAGTDTLVLALSEDAYKGDALFILLVDGVQVGGANTVTALHGQRQTQSFRFTGGWGEGMHKIAVKFLNDAYGGKPSLDRNLYVNSASYDGNAQTENLAQYGSGAAAFSLASAHLYKPGAAGGNITTLGRDAVSAGTGTVTVQANGPSVSVVGGTGQIAFIGAGGADTVVAGSGNVTLNGGAGILSYTAGGAAAAITAGSGQALYTIIDGQAGGSQTITGFSAGRDHIHLQGYSGTGSEQVIGGNTVIVLGDQTRITLVGVTQLTASQIFS